MSETSSELGVNGRKHSVNDLVDRLRNKTLAPRLPLVAHLSIGRPLCKLRDAILNGDEVSSKSTKTLLCCGIAMYRKHSLGEVGEEGGDETDESGRALIRKSTALILVLLGILEARSGNFIDAKLAQEVVKNAKASTLENVLEVRRQKRKVRDAEPPAAPEAPALAPAARPEAEAEAVASASASWEEAVAITSGELSMNVLKFVSCCISDESHVDYDALANLFFRTSAACMAQSLLLVDGARDFVSLNATCAHPISRENRLLGIAQAGESEAGQSCLRDLLLSFLLPMGIVGVRRNLLLSRSASTAAGVDYADAVNSAHSVAMAGTEYIWKHGTNPLERACALLAGVAVLTTKGGDDPIRKCDAFLGRVSLPFLETTSPEVGTKRLALITDNKRWVLYRVDKKNAPHVICNLRGFEGLCDCLLEFL